MRPPQTLVIGTFALLLALPGLQMKYRFVPEVALGGVRVEPKKPSLTLAGWWQGDLQSQAEDWFNDRIGFRGHAVRTDNQIGLSLFREASSNAVDHVILGKRMMLYTDIYVTTYDGIDAFLDEDLRAAAAGLRRLQDELAKRGTAFIFLVSPNKAVIYPEYLPEGFVHPPEQRPKTAYERMLPLLRSKEVHVVDGHALLLEEKARSPYPLFPPGGVHWNRYAASVVLRHAWRELSQQLGRPLVDLRSRGMNEDDTPSVRDQEADAAGLLNAWRVGHADWRYPRPDLFIDETGDASRPRIVVVGDSFWRVPAAIIEDLGMAGPRSGFLYYFNRPGGPDAPRGPDAEDIIQGVSWTDVLTADAIIIETNESGIGHAGWGFVEQALKRLRRAAPRPRPSR